MIRPLLLAALIYGGFAVADPAAIGGRDHAASFAVIGGGAVALWILKKVLDVGEGAAKLFLELVFLAGVAAYIVSTMPHAAGQAPLRRWADGARSKR